MRHFFVIILFGQEEQSKKKYHLTKKYCKYFIRMNCDILIIIIIIIETRFI